MDNTGESCKDWGCDHYHTKRLERIFNNGQIWLFEIQSRLVGWSAYITRMNTALEFEWKSGG